MQCMISGPEGLEKNTLKVTNDNLSHLRKIQSQKHIPFKHLKMHFKNKLNLHLSDLAYK